MSFDQLSEDYLRKLLENQNAPYVFLESLRLDKENQGSFLFSDFVDIVSFNRDDDLDEFFNKIENYLDKGYWLSGYFSYEFGYFLEPALASLTKKSNEPLAWLGVCKKPKTIFGQDRMTRGKRTEIFSEPLRQGQAKNLRANISRKQYLKQINKIKRYLAEGLTYQVNFTFKIKFDLQVDFLNCYFDLRRSQPTAYAGVINAGSNKVISLSPELFFRVKDRKIIVRPMKGTIKRGLTLLEDERLRTSLTKSDKIKSENIMIVDLLRNDLGRVADSVSATRLFEIEKHRTLYQMTSTIQARLKNNLKQKELFSALFPCGSVTGAPKIKTMQLIHELEKEPRGVYTGAIGYISPQRDSCFNVAIRTLSLEGQRGEIGIGGGVVYDSVGSSEYEEALLKTKFFIEGLAKFELIETLLLVNGNYHFLKLHLARLKKSSEYFLVPLDIRKAKDQLEKVTSTANGEFKVRLSVSLQGEVRVRKELLKKIVCPVKVKISRSRTDSSDVYLYHKTTKRKLYDQERLEASRKGFFEVIFLNTRGELTEGAISNIFILKKGQLYTPALKSGLLPGVLREHLLKKERAKEKVLYLKDFVEADKVYIGNSLRGLLEAEVVIPDKLVKAIEKTQVS
ncbi:MAG: aminodeoxychorismate synthase component I [Candidatus Omnitrophica bacterium]|nr:aminodeoxychorismate synthase component I [Candidatus Omnitrophota bacterium]